MLRRRKPYGKILLLFLAAAFITFIVLLNEIVRQTVYEMAEHNAVYQFLVKIHKDSGGRIVLVEANTLVLNKIASETTLAAQSALIRMREEELYIPLGQITGIYFLSNLGPLIKVDVVPLGTVRVDLEDRFEQAGINQTRHAIYLNFDTDVRIVVPLKSGRASVATQVPLAESIIVGDVPSTFVSLPEGLLGSGIKR